MKKFAKIWEVVYESFIGIGAIVWVAFYAQVFMYDELHGLTEPIDWLMFVSLMAIFIDVGVNYIMKYYYKIKRWIKSKKSEVAA